VASKHSGLRLGIDLGGSKIFAALLDQDQVLASGKRRTRGELGYDAVVERIARLADRVCRSAGVGLSKVASIGVGVPSPVVDNVLLHAPNLSWKNPPLAEDLGKALDVKRVRLGNDVNCGALGEAMLGAARGAQSVFAMFIGTGLGGGWVRNGKVHEGTSGFAGEVGHLQVPGLSSPCGCGQLGCLETVASKRGLVQLLQQARAEGKTCLLESLDPLKSKDVERAFREQCPATTDAFHAMAGHLAWAMNAVAAIINPDVFVLGGGIGQRLGGDLVPMIDRERAQATFVASHGPYEVRVGTLGPAAVAIGAAELHR
jgi:glucokinase